MVTRTQIINAIIAKFSFNTYLEIGVRDANENFNLINIEIKDGVDPAPVTTVNFKMTSDVFFQKESEGKKYDIIFIDGLHTDEQVYKDTINSIKHLNDGGFIVLHDCNPPTEYHIRSYEEYLKTRGQWNGTVFRGFIKLKNELLDWNCFTIDTDFGCGIITKHDFGFKTNIDSSQINWVYFNQHRLDLLNLISYNEFIDKLNKIK